MQEPGEEWEDALFQAALQVSSQMIEYLGNSLVKMIIEIQPFTSIKRQI